MSGRKGCRDEEVEKTSVREEGRGERRKDWDNSREIRTRRQDKAGRIRGRNAKNERRKIQTD